MHGIRCQKAAEETSECSSLLARDLHVTCRTCLHHLQSETAQVKALRACVGEIGCLTASSLQSGPAKFQSNVLVDKGLCVRGPLVNKGPLSYYQQKELWHLVASSGSARLTVHAREQTLDFAIFDIVIEEDQPHKQIMLFLNWDTLPTSCGNESVSLASILPSASLTTPRELEVRASMARAGRGNYLKTILISSDEPLKKDETFQLVLGFHWKTQSA